MSLLPMDNSWQSYTGGGQVDRPTGASGSGFSQPGGWAYSQSQPPSGVGQRNDVWANAQSSQQPSSLSSWWGQAGPNSADPFAYTSGSLLTPWTNPFTAPDRSDPRYQDSDDGGPAPQAPGFNFGNFGFGTYRERPDFEAPQSFGFDPYAAQSPFQGGPAFSYDPFGAPSAPLPTFSGPSGPLPTFSGPSGPLPTFSGPSGPLPTFSAPGSELPANMPLPTFNTSAAGTLPEYQKMADFQGLDKFGYDRFAPGARFQSTGDFIAPTAETLEKDPGYQFRVQQGLDTMQRSAAAQGLLRTGGTLKGLMDYGQGAASQEYQAAYNRALQQNELKYGRAASEYDRLYGQQLGEYQMGYGQATGERDREFAESTAAWDRNAQLRSNEFNAQMALSQAQYGRASDQYGRELQAGEIGYGRALGASQIQYGRASDQYGRELQANQLGYGRAMDQYGRELQANQLGYGRAMDQYGRELQANEIGYGRAAGEYDRGFQNTLAQNQLAYTRAASEYDRTYANQAAEYDRSYRNALEQYQTNFQNQFNVYNQNVQNAMAGSRLAYDQASGAYGLNFQTEQAKYNAAMQQYQMAQASRGGGPSSEQLYAQDYNRALAEYQMQYNIFENNQNNQYNRLMGAAGLGQNSLGMLGSQAINYSNLMSGNAGSVGGWANQLAFGQPQVPYGYPSGNYANNLPNLALAAGNAGAAGTIGGANAWSGAMGNIANNLTGLGMYYATQPPGYPSSPAGGGTPYDLSYQDRWS